MDKLGGFIFVLLLSSVFIIPTLTLQSCNSSASSSDPKQDSIFWDFYFGQSRKDFYETCSDLNKQGKVIQGNKNVSVAYLDTTNFKSQVEVNFYPKFNEKDKIYQMPVRMNYSFWAPWNKQLRADSLVAEVITQFEKNEGYTFKSGKDKFGRPKYIYRSGPKSIEVKNEDDYYILVTYENQVFE